MRRYQLTIKRKHVIVASYSSIRHHIMHPARWGEHFCLFKQLDLFIPICHITLDKHTSVH